MEKKVFLGELGQYVIQLDQVLLGVLLVFNWTDFEESLLGKHMYNNYKLLLIKKLIA